MRTFIAVLVATAAHAGCPLPEPQLESAAEGDRSFDAELDRRVLKRVVIGAERDRLRELDSIGAELGDLKDGPRLISYETMTLLTRLRQLDCRVLAARTIGADGLFVEIAVEARARLGNPAALTTIAEMPPLVPPSAERQAIANHFNGAFLVATSVASLAGTIGSALVASHAYDCHLGEGLFGGCGWRLFANVEYESGIAGAVVAATMTVATGIAGSVLLYRSGRSRRSTPSTKIVPTAMISRDGGAAGLRVTF